MFASNMRVARRARGWSLDELSALLSKTDTPLSKSGLSKVETGGRTLTIGEAVNVCRILHVSLDEMAHEWIEVQVGRGTRDE